MVLRLKIMEIEGLVEEFLDDMLDRGASASHRKRRAHALDVFARWCCCRGVESITPREVYTFLHEVRKPDGGRYASASLAGIVEGIVSFCKFLKKRGVISKGTYKQIKKVRRSKKYKYTTQRDRAVPVDDLAHVLAILAEFVRAGGARNVRDALVVSLCADNGPRIGGVHNIERRAAEKALASPRFINGWRVYEVLTVEKGKERLLAFYDGSAALMRRWLALVPESAVHLFCNTRTGAQLNRRTVTAAFDHICEYAGVPTFYSHAVRRRVLRDMRDLGDAHDAAAIAGHSSVQTTINHYLNDGRDRVLGIAAEAAARRRGADPLAAAFFAGVEPDDN